MVASNNIKADQNRRVGDGCGSCAFVIITLGNDNRSDL